MTASRLSAAMRTLLWGPRAVVKATGISERTVYRCLAGEALMPDNVLCWMERLAEFHKEHPAP